MSSYFHEAHRFDHQQQAYEESPVAKSMPRFSQDTKPETFPQRSNHKGLHHEIAEN
jgi:hypothetical protein